MSTPHSWGYSPFFEISDSTPNHEKQYPQYPPFWGVLLGVVLYPQRILGTPNIGGTTDEYPPPWGVPYIPTLIEIESTVRIYISYINNYIKEFNALEKIPTSGDFRLFYLAKLTFSFTDLYI